jgi:hypothetical protein
LCHQCRAYLGGEGCSGLRGHGPRARRCRCRARWGCAGPGSGWLLSWCGGLLTPRFPLLRDSRADQFAAGRGAWASWGRPRGGRVGGGLVQADALVQAAQWCGCPPVPPSR